MVKKLPFFVLDPKGNRGFFLLESVVAIMILGLASAGFFGMYTVANRSMAVAERHTTAAALAREKMEEVKSGGYWHAADGDEAEVAGYPAFSREVRVKVPEGAEGLRLWLVTVRVSWEEGEYKLSSYLAAR